MKNKEKNKGRNSNGQFTDGNTYGGSGKNGRYKNEYATELVRFFSEPPTRVDYIKRYDKQGNLIEEEPIELAAVYPTFEAFAIKIGVTVRTLENWRDSYKLFGEAYERAQAIQKNMLIVNGLGGRYNSSFAKFIAVNHHGMSDKVTNEHEFEGSDGFALNISIREPEDKDEKS